MFTPRSLLARKRLVACVLVIAALAAVSFLSNLGTVAQVGTTTAVVGIAQTTDGEGNVVYNPTNAQIDAAVREAVDLVGGLPENVGPGKKIVIQPNLVEAGWVNSNPADVGVVTNPQVVRTLVNMCIEAGASVSDIKICEGAAGFRGGDQGGYTSRQMTRKAYKDAGFDLNGDMIDDATGVQLVDANDVGYRYPDYPGYSGPYNSSYVTQVVKSNYLISRAYYLPNCVVECDVLIRVPCLKNHDLAGLTAGLKLAFGLAPTDIYHYPGLDLYKWALLHQQSWGYNELGTNSRGMVDMTLAKVPDLVVVDGLVGIMSGPVREPVARPNPYMACIIAGRDVVAVDAISALSIGYQLSTSSCPGVAYAAGVGLGQNNPGRIEVRGKRVSQIRRWFPSWGAGVPGEQIPPTIGGLTIPDNVNVCGAVFLNPTGFYDTGGSGVCKGELYVDDVLVDSNDVPSGPRPYGTTWNAAGATAGQYTLTYILYDRMLNEAQMTRTVNVLSGDPIRNALALADGAVASIGPVRVTGTAAAIDNQTFFVSSPDGLRGLRVRYGTTPAVSVGQEVVVYGTMATVDGQRYLNCTSYIVNGAGASLAPRLFSNKSLGGASWGPGLPGVHNGVGPYNVGCLVKTTGRVSAGGADYFYISDGSLNGVTDGVSKIKVKCGSFAQPAPGSFVTVIGFSCTESDGGSIHRLLVARSAADMTAH